MTEADKQLTQIDFLPFVQIVSITGILGISFIIGWTASVINWMWIKKFNWSNIKSGVTLLISVLVVIFLFGIIRLNSADNNKETVRIAGISSPNNIFTGFLGIDKEYFNSIEEKSEVYLNLLLKKTDKVIEDGAQIVFWQEGCLPVIKENEKKFISLIQNYCKENNIYLGASIFVIPPNFPKEKGENKIVWINTKGVVKWQYLKANPIPFVEPSIAGTGKLQTDSTAFGNISSFICYDLDFPTLINQTGIQDVDIVLVPASDWDKISPYHTKIAYFRAIENGFSLIRSTGYGYSAGVDYKGRFIGGSDYFHDEYELLVNIPTRGVITFYAKFGDVFAWSCIIAFITFIIISIKIRKK